MGSLLYIFACHLQIDTDPDPYPAYHFDADADLMANNLIKDTQHGFMPGRSCATNLTEFMDKVTRSVDEGSSVDIIYLDFAKAFDKVPRQRLLNKL